MFEELKYIREIKRLKEEIAFYNGIIDGAAEREKRMRAVLQMTIYHRKRAQKRLAETLAVLKNGGDLCELCANMADDACGGKCPECTLPCPCRFCENGSGFEFKEDKK